MRLDEIYIRLTVPLSTVCVGFYEVRYSGNQPQANSDSDPLTGIAIGIGVAVAVSLIAIIGVAAAAFCCRRRKGSIRNRELFRLDPTFNAKHKPVIN